MKTILTTLVLLGTSSTFANTVELNGSPTWNYRCKMVYGYATDSDNITLIQSKDVFFRLPTQGTDIHPKIILTNSDKNGISHSNPVNFGYKDCSLMKRCIDQFSSSEVSVAARCEEGVLKVEFRKLD